MSRSRKKTPYSGMRKSKAMKAIANRKVRRALSRDFDLDLSGKAYRKWVSSYDICDYYDIAPKNFEEYWKRRIKAWYDFGLGYTDPPTKEEAMRDYQRWYVRK